FRRSAGRMGPSGDAPPARRGVKEDAMRRILGLALAAGVVLGAGAARAGDRDRALAVIGQAIKAQGGERELARALVSSWHTEGTQSSAGTETKFSSDVVASLPDRVRMTLT